MGKLPSMPSFRDDLEYGVPLPVERKSRTTRPSVIHDLEGDCGAADFSGFFGDETRIGGTRIR